MLGKDSGNFKFARKKPPSYGVDSGGKYKVLGEGDGAGVQWDGDEGIVRKASDENETRMEGSELSPGPIIINSQL